MPRLRLAVIYGGNKASDGAVIYQTANCRPWKSYQAVAEDIAMALRGAGFEHVILLPDDAGLAERLRREQIHLAWLNTGGVQGRDPMSHAPAVLETLGIPYVGHNSLNVSRLDNKHVFKRELAWLGVPSAPFLSWSPADGSLDASGAAFRRAFGAYTGPFVVKPVTGRASLLVQLVRERDAVPAAVMDVFEATRNAVLVETFLPGREFCVAAAGPVTCRGGRFVRGDRPFAFAAVERVLPPGEPISPSMDRSPIQSRMLSPDERVLKEALQALARRIYTGFDLEAICRVDLRMDAHGKLHVLEANPKPDLAFHADNISLVARGLPEEGMDYQDLVLGLLGDRLLRLLAGQDLGHPHVTAFAPVTEGVT